MRFDNSSGLDEADRSSGGRTVVANNEGVPTGCAQMPRAPRGSPLAKSSRLVDRPQGRRNLRPGDSAFHETCLRTLSMTARSGLYRVRVGTPGVLLY